MMDEDRQQVIWTAYLATGVLKTMTRAAGLPLAHQRASDLLIELEQAFPFIAERKANLQMVIGVHHVGPIQG